ncbi:MAG: methyltransferase domain-containing protein [Nitrosopumilus sp.]|uniref:TRM11 family SAM-dependent methyltransferase n=1 Tax=Nitrosopumilus sp. TaxID=2024843 RepID=UPI00247CD7C9|nr:DNA methyltransferase [Nitrosopumilus sp.]MCV0393331.1 methyltransferase domain-containing protein [Nitrosopumilus sp.]
MPESFFVLSKDHLELAIDEITALAKMYDRFSKIKVLSNLVIVQSKINWTEIEKRASFVKISGQILRKMSGLFLDEDNFEVLKNAKSFVCRIINLSSNQFNVPELENSMGDMISKFSHAKVELEDPDITVYLIFTNEENFFGFSKKDGNKHIPKKIKNHPHELDRKMTRLMLNLVGLKEGETVCDPFCGTGTTLLEAESMGIHAIGIDFDEKMCEISKQNLKANRYKSEVINSDFQEMTKISEKFDGIVTDLPYGRASKVSDNPEKIIKKFFTILPKRKKLAVMYKKELGQNLKLKGLKKYEIYRHKSLTRTILIK